MAERLKGAQNTYAMLTTFNEIDMTNIMQLRKDFKASWPCKLCYMQPYARPSFSTAHTVQVIIADVELSHNCHLDVKCVTQTQKPAVLQVVCALCRVS